MSQVKWESFESTVFALVIVPRERGSWRILDIKTGKESPLAVGFEGLEDYIKIKRAFKRSRKDFNKICRVIMRKGALIGVDHLIP